jgi:hypothetical protein
MVRHDDKRVDADAGEPPGQLRYLTFDNTAGVTENDAGVRDLAEDSASPIRADRDEVDPCCRVVQKAEPQRLPGRHAYSVAAGDLRICIDLAPGPRRARQASPLPVFDERLQLLVALRVGPERVGERFPVRLRSRRRRSHELLELHGHAAQAYEDLDQPLLDRA